MENCVDNVENIEKLDGVNEIKILKQIGDKIDKIQSSTDRIGYIITQGNDIEQAIKINESAMNLLDLKFKV